MTKGRLSTHVLDTARGVPAVGVRVEVWRNDVLVASAVTNGDGRTDAPLVPEGQLAVGPYELRFFTGEYFREGLYDTIPVRVRIERPDENHHVPLLVSPWAYSTYRGS